MGLSKVNPKKKHFLDTIFCISQQYPIYTLYLFYLNSLNFCTPYIFAPSNFYSPNFHAPLKYGLLHTLLFSCNIYFIKFFNTVLNEKS